MEAAPRQPYRTGSKGDPDSMPKDSSASPHSISRQLEFRNRIVEVFLSTPDEGMYTEVLKILLEATDSPYGVLGYLTEEGDLVLPTLTRTVWNECQVEDKQFIFQPAAWGGSTWGRSLREGVTFIVEEPSSSTPAGHIRIRRHISMPLVHHGRVVGVTMVANKSVPYSEDDVEVLGALCNAFAPVLDARLQAEWRQAARERSDAVKTQLEAQLRQAQKLEAIGRLAGGTAHDFNNQLTVILGFADLVAQSLGDAHPLTQDVGEIIKAATSAAGLTRHLLAFSRRQVLRPVVVQINSLICDLEKMLRRLVEEDIELHLFLDSSLWLVKADPNEIQQVLMNLVVNARDAMPHGGRISVETANVDIEAGYSSTRLNARPGSYVRIAVTDTGLGMDEDTQAHAFEPFYTTKEVGKGTGLGLSTVYGIVTQSGGFVEFESALNRGTTFRVHLPRVVAGRAVEVATVAPPIRVGGGEAVLLVEDDEAVRKFACRALAAAGFQVLTAANAGEAVLLAEEADKRPDIMVTDVVMPGTSGRKLAERMARIRPEMKVLLMSGYEDHEDVHGIGGDDFQQPFLKKPFLSGDLVRKVRETLDTKVARAANGEVVGVPVVASAASERTTN